MATDNETIEAAERFRAESRLRTLFFAIAWKKLRRDLRVRSDGAESIASLAANDTAYESEVDASRDLEALRNAIRRLPEDTQTVLALFYWEVMSIQEIARAVEQPVNIVKTRLRRGRAMLLEELVMLRGEE
jgi:RNA polymerase sigma factor (sigma-70 family)